MARKAKYVKFRKTTKKFTKRKSAPALQRGKLSNSTFKRDYCMMKETIMVNINMNNGFDTAGNYFFQPSQLPQFKNYCELYEQWKLHHVVISWVPKSNINTVAGSGITSSIMYCRWNPNNNISGIPTNAEMIAAGNNKISNVFKKYSKKLYPVAKQQVGYAGLTTYYIDVPSNKLWFQSLNGSVSDQIAFYGFDWHIPDMQANITNIGTWQIDYYMMFKGQR